MNKKKALIFDVDGTLIPFDEKGVDVKVIETLNSLKDQYYLFVATGRHVLELSDLDGIDFDAYITSDGQVVTISSGETYISTIPNEDIKAVIDYVTKNQIACAFTEKDEYYINFINQKAEKYHDYVVFNTPKIKDIKRAIDNDILVVTIFDNDYVIEDVLKKMPHVKMVRSNQYGADLLSKTSGKGFGVMEACKHFEIDLKDTIVFGDGENDLEMFEICGKSCAMGNADKIIKKHATYITSDIKDNGIINGLKYFKVLEDE